MRWVLVLMQLAAIGLIFEGARESWWVQILQCVSVITLLIYPVWQLRRQK